MRESVDDEIQTVREFFDDGDHRRALGLLVEVCQRQQFEIERLKAQLEDLWERVD